MQHHGERGPGSKWDFFGGCYEQIPILVDKTPFDLGGSRSCAVDACLTKHKKLFPAPPSFSLFF